MPRPVLTGCSHSLGLNEEEEEIQPSYYYHHIPHPPDHHIPCPPDHIKNLISSGDNQLKDTDDTATFSLKRMPKNKSRCVGRQYEPKNRSYRKKMARQTLGLEEVSSSSEQLEFQEPLYNEAAMTENLSNDDDDDWRESYPPSAYDTVHESRMSHMAPCNMYSYNSPNFSGLEAFSSWPFTDNDRCDSCLTHTKAAESFAPHEESRENVEYAPPHASYHELVEENSVLKRKIKKMQNFSENQTQMVRSLERKLLATVNKEVQEAHELEVLVQQAEHGLQSMSQRALKAECDLEKARQEIYFLRAELSGYKMENESLRSGQSANMGAVKNHIDVALQNLHKVTSHAHATIHQLVFGAETLTLVADLLKSVGRMSEIETENVAEEQT